MNLNCVSRTEISNARAESSLTSQSVPFLLHLTTLHALFWLKPEPREPASSTQTNKACQRYLPVVFDCVCVQGMCTHTHFLPISTWASIGFSSAGVRASTLSLIFSSSLQFMLHGEINKHDVSVSDIILLSSSSRSMEQSTNMSV